MLIPTGHLITLYNPSQEIVGHAWGDPGEPRSFWMLPPTEDRPPDPGVSFTVDVAIANVTHPEFIQVVREAWKADSWYCTCNNTEYTSFDAIPSEYEDRFFPNAPDASGRPNEEPLEIDMGTTGIYMASSGENVGVVYRETVGNSYNEYWITGPNFNNSVPWNLTAGTIHAGFDTWTDGTTCTLVVSSEMNTEPVA